MGHIDPHWDDMTYGDIVGGARGGALRRVIRGDILLFWGMLWENEGSSWEHFTGSHSWFLLGSMRVGAIIESGTRARDVPRAYRVRALRNAHFHRRLVPDGHRIFIGSRKYSRKFRRAVPLDFHRENGLAYKTCTAKSGELLVMGSRPRWGSSLRACRAMWDVANSPERKRANVIRRAIEQFDGFDFLANIPEVGQIR